MLISLLFRICEPKLTLINVQPVNTCVSFGTTCEHVYRLVQLVNTCVSFGTTREHVYRLVQLVNTCILWYNL